MDTYCFRFPDIIYPEPAHSYSVSRMFCLRFMTWFHTRSRQILALSQTQLDSHSAWMLIPGYCNTLFFMNGLTLSLIVQGSMEKDTNILYMCSYSSCWKTLLTIVCVPTASRDAQAWGPGLSTPNWGHCVHTTAEKRHKAAIQNTPMNPVLLVFSCTLPAWYISCWMTFKVDPFLLFLS